MVQYRDHEAITFDHVDLKIVADKLHSVPTLLLLTVDAKKRLRWLRCRRAVQTASTECSLSATIFRST